MAQGHHWLKGGRLFFTKYQALLLDSPELTLQVECQSLSLATLIDIFHSCVETIEQVLSSRPGLKDIALGNPQVEWFTNGSTSVNQGRRQAMQS